MNIEEVRAYALSLAEVTEDMPFGDDNVCFRIHGKIFLCLNLYSDEPHFAIKLQPKRSEELREQYEGEACMALEQEALERHLLHTVG